MKLEIEGERIVIRALRKTDARDIQRHAKRREISRYSNVPHPYTMKKAREFIRHSHKEMRKGSAYHLGIANKRTGKIIGMIALGIDKKNRNAEAGYWLAKEYRGRGIATEALKLILSFGFRRLKLVRIWARVMHPNKRSAELLERCGFRYEGRLRKNTFRNGRWMDDLRYGILREDYKS
ncbi:MAG: GNAT family N-acetyltransferase [Candidatus Aenigmarchaeota archaeon]|nr:GNAT family N-acetyltransferase [Candidatus Aenigmarchaeota archaeon]